MIKHVRVFGVQVKYPFCNPNKFLLDELNLHNNPKYFIIISKRW